MLTNYCKTNHSKHNTYKLFSEKPFQTMLINHYKGNHSKQSLQNFIREIIRNNNYKLLSDNSFQTILNIPFVREIIPNKA